MLRAGAEQLAAFHFPGHQGTLETDRGELFAVSAECQTCDRLRMAPERVQDFVRREVPDLDRAVEAAARQAPTIRTESHRAEFLFMAAQNARSLAGLVVGRWRIPEPHGAVEAG